KVRRRITLGMHRKLEVRYGIVEVPLLDEVGADVVIRIAKIGIELDRLLALLDGRAIIAQEAVGPSEERVCLGGRQYFDRFLIIFDRLVQMTRHLQPIRALEKLLRPLLEIATIIAIRTG